MDFYALDKDYNVVTVGIAFTNMQWIRRYYEAGEFQMQVPENIYNTEWAYIGTAERPELGTIESTETEQDASGRFVLLSGFFAEKRLDWKCCYPRFVKNANTETLVREMFSTYKGDLEFELGKANNPLLGEYTQADFVDDYLGTKAYSILETRELSQRIRYDYEQNKLFYEVWQGLDRTQSQSKNPYYTFSSDFGNVDNENITVDSSAYRNYCIIPAAEDDTGKETFTLYVDWTNGEQRREIVLDKRSSQKEKDQTLADFKESLKQEGMEELLKYQTVTDIEVDVVSQGDYMTAYDLGDKVNAYIASLDLLLETRIIEVTEVIKAEGHTITVGLGNKKLANY